MESGNYYGGLALYFANGVGGKIGSGPSSQDSYGENLSGYYHFETGINFSPGYKLGIGVSVDASSDFGTAKIASPIQELNLIIERIFLKQDILLIYYLQRNKITIGHLILK